MAHGQSILLVEDDRDIRETILEALEDEGYSVVGAFDGLDALERLRGASSLPSLILLDLMMPRMSGPEFCAEVAKVAEWSSIPIVLLTADAQVQAKAEALGATAFLRKPIKLAQLFDVMLRVLGNGSQSAATDVRDQK